MLRSAFRGAVAAALDADDVIEVLANPDGSIWIERAGAALARDAETLDAEARERIIRLVAGSVGEVCNRANPVISAELPGSGERFEGLLPPVSEAPCFAIRKPAAAPFTLYDYVKSGALAPAVADALRCCLAERANIVIAGGTSSGKTTLRMRCLPNRPSRRSASSFSKIPASSNARRRTQSRSERMAKGQVSHGLSGPPCAFAPTASSSARCAAPKRSIS